MRNTAEKRQFWLESEIPDAVRRRNATYFSLGGLSVALAAAPPSLARAWRHSLIRNEALALSILQGGPGDRDQYLHWLEPADAYLLGEDDHSDRAIALDLTGALGRAWDPDYPFRPDAERVRQLLDGATPSLGSRRVSGGREAALWYQAVSDLFLGHKHSARHLGQGYQQFGRAVFSFLDAVHEPIGGVFGVMAQHAALLGPILERQAVPALVGPTVPVGAALPCPVVGLGSSLWLYAKQIEALPSEAPLEGGGIEVEIKAWDRIWFRILERAGEDGLTRYSRIASAHRAWNEAGEAILFDVFAERPRQTVTSIAERLGVSYRTARRYLDRAAQALRDGGLADLRKRRSPMSAIGERAIYYQADALI
ncbi:MAG: hypothetical protein RLW87_20715 [Alphaproteobacteria bacterium]